MLQFEQSWRFTSPGPIPGPIVHAFYDFIDKIAGQGDTWSIVETFKYHFSGGTGHSSSLRWAWSDLLDCMNRAAENAPLFIEAFYKGCSAYEASGLGLPDLGLVNSILAKHKAGYEIRPPYLIATTDYIPIVVPRQTPSLAAQARPMIDDALAASEQRLSEGKGRQAVSELLWLLETISTAFRGAGDVENSVQGKYFNAIIREMRVSNKGKAPGANLKLDDNVAWLPFVSNRRRNPPWHGLASWNRDSAS